jgi:hypothetical protein
VIAIVINADDAATLGLWHAVAELSERLPAGWVLIGGLMVQLHALEHGIVHVRPTRDIDVLVQARPRGALPVIDEVLRNDGFELHEPDLDGYGYRYERNGLIVDVLAPDGLSLPPGVTAVGVPGGMPARCEVSPMSAVGYRRQVRRESPRDSISGSADVLSCAWLHRARLRWLPLCFLIGRPSLILWRSTSAGLAT